MRRIAAAVMAAILFATSGCAVVAGGLAGSAIGYTVGTSSKADDNAAAAEEGRE